MTYLKQHLLGALGLLGAGFPLEKQLQALFGGWRLNAARSKIHRRRVMPLLILNYHRVLQHEDPFAIDAITTREFETQIKILHKHFQVLSLPEAVQSLKNDAIDQYSVCITFDDGYQDNFEYAFPILNKYNVPATIFLTTDFINSDKLLWHDEVLRAFKNAQNKTLNVPGLSIDNVSLNSVQDRRATAFRVLEKLKAFAPDERDSHIEKIQSLLEINNSTENRMMLNWKEVSAMAASGINFGAHTKSHPILSTLDDSCLHDEIIGSKQAIENKINAPITTFAYPNGREGDYDQRTISILREAEFACAVTTKSGVNEPENSVYELARIAPWETNPHRFYGRLLLNPFFN
jgi:peptidoglycan/xylan/chitin deacetylase (PgdA/CDA1 family)